MKSPKTEAQAVLQFKPFVIKTAGEFKGSGVPEEDLIQEGLLAVALAYRQWRPDGGASLLTWIYRPVHYAMLHLIEDNRRAGGRAKKGRVRQKWGVKDVRLVSLDAPLEQVQKLSVNRRAASYLGEVKTLHDVVGFFEDPADAYAEPSTFARLADAVGQLEQRERQVIRLRFEKGLTHVEVGKRLKISREQASQIEKAAIARLKELMGSTNAAS